MHCLGGIKTSWGWAAEITVRGSSCSAAAPASGWVVVAEQFYCCIIVEDHVLQRVVRLLEEEAQEGSPQPFHCASSPVRSQG